MILLTMRRPQKISLILLAGVGILGTASALAPRLRPEAVGDRKESSIVGSSRSLQFEPPLSASMRASALQALAEYEAAKPRRASDHFHRWCFEGLKGAYALNPKLQAEVDQLRSKSGFRRAFPGSPPLFFRSPYGWEVRQRTAEHVEKHWEYEPHVDQFLAACAQIGAPLNLEIETDFGQVSIGELLEASRQSFDFSQEPCWTLVAYCTYLPEESQWQNRFGDSCSYESIVQAILALPLDSGPCAGTHKQFALAYYLDSPSSARLSQRLRRKCEDYLERSSKLLEQSQLPSGAWTPLWAAGSADSTGPLRSIHGVDLIRTTGHQLEWVCVAPSAVRPSMGCVGRALHFLIEALNRADITTIQKEYCPYSHAACVIERALMCDRTTAPEVRREPPQIFNDFVRFPAIREGSRVSAQTP